MHLLRVFGKPSWNPPQQRRVLPASSLHAEFAIAGWRLNSISKRLLFPTLLYSSFCKWQKGRDKSNNWFVAAHQVFQTGETKLKGNQYEYLFLTGMIWEAGPFLEVYRHWGTAAPMSIPSQPSLTVATQLNINLNIQKKQLMDNNTCRM